MSGNENEFPRVLGKMSGIAPRFWFLKGHISGMIWTEKLWFHKSDTHVILTQHGWWCTDETPTSSRLRSPEVPSCDWGYGCFDSSGKACMKLSEKVQTTYSYTQIQKCTYQSYELWVSDCCLAHEFWRSPAFLAFLVPKARAESPKDRKYSLADQVGPDAQRMPGREIGKTWGPYGPDPSLLLLQVARFQRAKDEKNQ